MNVEMSAAIMQLRTGPIIAIGKAPGIRPDPDCEATQ